MAAVVQSVKALSPSATSLSAALTGVQAGSTLLVVDFQTGNSGSLTVSNTGASALTFTGDRGYGYSNYGSLSHSTATVAGDYTITIATSAANPKTLMVIEARLAATQVDVIQTASNYSSGSTTVTNTPLTTGIAHDLLVAVAVLDRSTTVTGAAGYTLAQKNETTTAGLPGAVQFREVTATGSQTAPFTLGTSVSWADLFVAYRAEDVVAADLAGSATGSGTSGATLTSAPALTGTAPGGGTASAALVPSPVVLAGAATGAGSARATLTAPIPQGAIIGSASGSGAATAALTTTPATLGGTLPGTGAAIATLGVPAAVLAGAATGAGSAIATLGVPAAVLAGTAAGAGSASATLLYPFGGRLPGAGGASATVLVRVGVGGRLAGLGAASATLDVRPFLYRTILVTTGGRRG